MDKKNIFSKIKKMWERLGTPDVKTIGEVLNPKEVEELEKIRNVEAEVRKTNNGFVKAAKVNEKTANTNAKKKATKGRDSQKVLGDI